MNCWIITLRVIGKTQEEINEFKNYVKSSDYIFDFQNVIPIPECTKSKKSNSYLSFWHTYYRPTFAKLEEETPNTIWYRFDTDEIPEPIFFKLSHLFPNIKINVYAELNKKLILGGGILKAIFKFNNYNDKTLYEVNDLSFQIYQEEIVKKIKKLNRKNSATKFEIEELMDLINAYNDYPNIPHKIKFLQSIFPKLYKFPRIQHLLKLKYPGAFRDATINSLLEIWDQEILSGN